MLPVNEYIKMILKKKHLTLAAFADKINEVKEGIGINSKTTKQNISNFLNQVDDKHILRPKQLAIWEKALELEEGTLMNMVAPPVARESKKELRELIKKVREYRNVNN